MPALTVNGKSRSLDVTPVSALTGKQLRTIEAMQRHPVGLRVQAAWRELDVLQCGCCQSGQVMAA